MGTFVGMGSESCIGEVEGRLDEMRKLHAACSPAPSLQSR